MIDVSFFIILLFYSDADCSSVYNMMYKIINIKVYVLFPYLDAELFTQSIFCLFLSNVERKRRKVNHAREREVQLSGVEKKNSWSYKTVKIDYIATSSGYHYLLEHASSH